jgi:RNA polymerase sigma-70 factor (ECF subfamily)
LETELRDLTGACLRGDEVAKLRLVERFADLVMAICLRTLGRREDAEDAFQETFIRTFRSLHRWDPARPFEPWIATIAVNRCRTTIAKRKREPRELGELETDSLAAAPSGDYSLAFAEDLELALAQLRPEYRQAFAMFHFQEKSYQEISETLGCPLGTVKTWVHRARCQLQEIFERRGWTPEPDRDAMPRI